MYIEAVKGLVSQYRVEIMLMTELDNDQAKIAEAERKLREVLRNIESLESQAKTIYNKYRL